MNENNNLENKSVEKFFNYLDRLVLDELILEKFIDRETLNIEKRYRKRKYKAEFDIFPCFFYRAEKNFCRKNIREIKIELREEFKELDVIDQDTVISILEMRTNIPNIIDYSLKEIGLYLAILTMIYTSSINVSESNIAVFIWIGFSSLFIIYLIVKIMKEGKMNIRRKGFYKLTLEWLEDLK